MRCLSLLKTKEHPTLQKNSKKADDDDSVHTNLHHDKSAKTKPFHLYKTIQEDV